MNEKVRINVEISYDMNFIFFHYQFICAIVLILLEYSNARTRKIPFKYVYFTEAQF